MRQAEVQLRGALHPVLQVGADVVGGDRQCLYRSDDGGVALQ